MPFTPGRWNCTLPQFGMKLNINEWPNAAFEPLQNIKYKAEEKLPRTEQEQVHYKFFTYT